MLPRRLSLVMLSSTVLIALAHAVPSPEAPFGESSRFILNTNRIGFGDAEPLVLTSVPIPPRDAARLGTAAPNPFNPRTIIPFTLPRDGRVRLTVHDLRGRVVRRLVDGHLAAGRHHRLWDGRSDQGLPAASGVYLVRLQALAGAESRKIVLVR